MSFTDKSILCPDCGTTFIFTAGEQEFFASKGFTNDPKRCPQCRQAKKQQRAAVHKVAIATAAPHLVGNTSLALSTYIGWGNTWPMCVPIQFLSKGYQYEYPCR
jgi:hypothetical protein